MTSTPHPVEISPPEISRWRNGNTGIEYAHSFVAQEPGPHVMILGVTHGNEICGAVVVDRLLATGLKPRRGRLTLAFHNAAAYLRFDVKNPNSMRFIDEDLNRVWGEERLDGAEATAELLRARAMRPLVDSVDCLLDLHSMDSRAEPLLLIHGLEKERRLARRMGYPRVIVCGPGHVKGRRLLEYTPFNDSKKAATAVLVECGQHWEKAAANVAMDSALYFLKAVDAVDPAFIEARLTTKKPAPQRLLEVTHGLDATTDAFRWSRPFVGLEEIPTAGTVVAMDGATPVKTPYDRCVLVMPRQAPKKDERVLRFARDAA